MAQLGWLHAFNAQWTVGAMAGEGDARNAANAKGTLRQLGAGAQYQLSKRTQLYGIYSNLDSDGATGKAYSGTPGIGAPANSLRSSGSTQNVLRVGVLHKF
jgi:predicted porin